MEENNLKFGTQVIITQKGFYEGLLGFIVYKGESSYEDLAVYTVLLDSPIKKIEVNLTSKEFRKFPN